MKPYGLRNKFRYNYTDCHPKKLGKGWVNWWESELHTVKNKKSIRLKIKRLLNERDFDKL
jgi:hypothetical protein